LASLADEPSPRSFSALDLRAKPKVRGGQIPIVIPAKAARRHSRESGTPSFPRKRHAVIPAKAALRHSRESGNPLVLTVAKWIPASAGMTLDYCLTRLFITAKWDPR
jgi:hypothetical protein